MTEKPEEGMYPQTGKSYLPVPDPTVLTTQALQREILTARELVEIKLMGLRDTIGTRINGMESTLKVIEDRVNVLLDRATHEVKQLQALHETKFGAIQMQFEDRDKRTEVLALADKTAIAAALQAQKEAVAAQNESNAVASAKAESNFSKQIDQLQSIVNTIAKGTDDKISDLKGRMDQGAGKEVGSKDITTVIMGVAALIISFGTLFFLIYSHNITSPSWPPSTQQEHH